MAATDSSPWTAANRPVGSIAIDDSTVSCKKAAEVRSHAKHSSCALGELLNGGNACDALLDDAKTRVWSSLTIAWQISTGSWGSRSAEVSSRVTSPLS